MVLQNCTHIGLQKITESYKIHASNAFYLTMNHRRGETFVTRK